MFVISPDLSPERIAFELTVQKLPAEIFATALGELVVQKRLTHLLLSQACELPLSFSYHFDFFPSGLHCPSAFEAANEYRLLHSTSTDSTSASILTGNESDDQIRKAFFMLIDCGRYEEALRLAHDCHCQVISLSCHDS